LDRRQKLASFCCNRVPRAQVLGRHCIVLNSARPPSALVTSDVNGVLKRKIASPQWDDRARSSRCRHHRCIGCEQILASLPWAFRLLLLPAYPLSQLAFLASQITSFRGLNSSTTPVDMQRSVVSFALLVQACCKQLAFVESSYPALTPISRLKQARPLGTTQTGSGAPAAVALPSVGIKISLSKWVHLALRRCATAQPSTRETPSNTRQHAIQHCAHGGNFPVSRSR
jgi:hypothetical protein